MKESKRHKGASPAFFHSRVISIISISMVLFLLGVVAMMGLVGGGLRDYVREHVSFTILLSPEATSEEIATMERELKGERFVKEVSYYSKEQALEELKGELGEDPEDFLGWNPLSPAFEVQLHADYLSHRDSISMVEKKLGGYLLTQSLSYKHDLVEELNKNIQTITLVMSVVAGLLLLISIVLINNTIRLLIYSRRFSIYTMKLVGAKSGFIRGPFIRYNVWSGIVAAFLAMGLLAWGWYYLISHYPLMGEVLSRTNMLIVGGVVLIAGILISWLSASLAVSKYLRMDMNKLYRA